jgi:hypothetical protein
MKLYQIFNTASIVSIVVLKNFINVKNLVTAYTIIDTISLLVIKKLHSPRKRNQLLLHHVAGLTTGFFLKDVSPKLLEKSLDLEYSTAAVVINRCFRNKVVNVISSGVWLYYRIYFTPKMVNTIKNETKSKAAIVGLNIIESLGFVWTFEILKVPRQFLRPCVVSIIYSSNGVFKRTLESKMYLLSLHIIILNISSVLHHSNHVVPSKFCKFDNIICRTFTFHIFLISPDKILFAKQLAVVKGLHLLTHLANQDDSSRDYENIINVLPNILMHSFTFYSIQYSLFDIPLQKQRMLQL